jgi:ubiquinone/menaquinone biosynthesis C-methylase UbiE
VTDAATVRLRQEWESQANSWYRERELLLSASRPIHQWLVEHLEPRAGQRVLEIAAGPGDTGLFAAQRLGNGRLVSTDLAPAMVDAAKKRGAELGLTNVDYRTLDAQAMDLADASFDGVICRWGFMLMPDPEAALAECRRVLVPGGRLVFAVFTGPEDNSFASLPARVLIEAGHLPRPASNWQPGILALGDRARLDALVRSVPFASVHIEPVDMTWTFVDTDDYWRFLVDVTALGPVVRSLSDSARAAVRTEIDARLARFTRAGQILLPARCWCGLLIR